MAAGDTARAALATVRALDAARQDPYCATQTRCRSPLVATTIEASVLPAGPRRARGVRSCRRRRSARLTPCARRRGDGHDGDAPDAQGPADPVPRDADAVLARRSRWRPTRPPRRTAPRPRRAPFRARPRGNPTRSPAGRAADAFGPAIYLWWMTHGDPDPQIISSSDRAPTGRGVV